MIALLRLAKWAVAAVASAAALALLAGASGAPLPYHDSDVARLRLSWRALPERIEVCRVRSAEELAELGEHMRQRMDCDGRFASYTLRVELDGHVLDESVVRGSGLRHDRPLYVLRDFDMPPGVHHARVSLIRRERPTPDSASGPSARATADTGIFAGRAERESVERSRRAQAAIPERLVLDTTMRFTPARVVLVTYNVDRRALTPCSTPCQQR